MRRLPAVLIGVGIVLRLVKFLADRSLWVDECFLALNVTGRSFAELAGPLDYHQVAPLGFLVLQKLAVAALGNSEYALRLWPLLTGIASLFLLHRVARETLSPRAVLLAVGLFAILDPLVYYASECKQYSSDVAAALFLFTLAIPLTGRGPTWRSVVPLGAAGGAAIWLSHPAVFTLAGVAGTLAVLQIRRRAGGTLWPLLAVVLAWAGSFAVAYQISFHTSAADPYHLRAWRDSFMPFPPRALADFAWYPATFFGFFRDPLGLSLHGIGALAFLVGALAMLSGRREKLALLVAPILVTLVASALHRYPFRGRVILFLVPVAVLLIAEGVERIRERTASSDPLIGAVVLGLVFLPPLLTAGHHLVRPPASHEEIKPVLRYIQEHRREGDVLYLYYASRYAFQYYAGRYDLDTMPAITGVSSKRDWGRYEQDLEGLRGKGRVWVLFAHVWIWNGVDEEKFFLHHLDRLGARRDSFRAPGASVYLYDLRGSGSPAAG